MDALRPTRLGLKPIRRRVWAPIGRRPTALGHHRHQWLHVAAFVRPTGGEAVWHLCGGLSKPFSAEPLAAFARQVGAGRERSVVLVLDDAGWHGPQDLAVPDGITLAFLPPHSPELQPAEHLWPLVDEPSTYGRWWTSRSPTGTSPRSASSAPSSPRAVGNSMPTPSSRTPTFIGGPGPFSRTDHPEVVSCDAD